MTDRGPDGHTALLEPGTAVVVTGAARGIGLATARRAAAHGARLAVCDRHGDELESEMDALRASGTTVHSATLDVRDGAAATRFMADVDEHLGPVDVLVNNAGGSFNASFLDVSDKGEAMLVAENFTQVTRLIRLAAPTMPRGSSIVNVTSSEAFQAAPGFAVYAAMKAALESLTRSLALELAPAGIRVNSIAPDALTTRGEDDARAELVESPVPYSPTQVPPLGHCGTPDDGANAVLFLASPLARFITGTTIHVDGGINAAGGWRLDTDTVGPDSLSR